MAEIATSEHYEGSLYKLRGNGKKWKKRYFILDGDTINYYKKKDHPKIHGSIALSQAKGVREMSKCKCTWPSEVTEEYGFGLATENRTFYFHTTSEEGGVSDWKYKTQAMIEMHGHPNSNWKDDHKGAPEGNKSFIARKAAAVAAKSAKVATKVPGVKVDKRVLDMVDVVADVVEEQAEMDPNTSIEERALKGTVTAGKGALGELTK